MTPHHEHEFEAAPGLPEPLPAGERILWQGAPEWRTLAVRAFHLRKLAVYFAAMLGLQALYLWDQGGAAMASSLTLGLVLAGVSLSLVTLTAWLAARHTLYTLTTRRVVMRIGIVLTITLNLPLRQVRGADLLDHGQEVGDLSLALAGQARLGWLHLWPHARPWALRDPQPCLRCIPQAAAVGARLHAAWQQAQLQMQAQPAAAAAPAPAPAQPAQALDTPPREVAHA